MPRFPRLALSLLAAVLLSACGDLLSTAAATVDARKIDEERFNQELDFLLADPRFAQELPQGEQGDVRRKELGRQYLTFLIHQQVVRAYAEENGIRVPQEEVDALLQSQIAQTGGRQQFDRQLAKTGMTEEDVRTLLEEQVLRERVAEAVVAERVSEATLREAYEERLAEFSEVEVAHILVSSEAEARRIAGRVTPENFATMARQLSEDPGSAQQGGDLGTVPAAQLVQPFGRAALEAEVGSVTGPVQTQFGYHLILVKDRTVRPFEEVRPELLEEVRRRTFSEWLAERLQRAEVRVNPRYGVFDEQSGSVVERRSSTPLPEPTVQLEP